MTFKQCPNAHTDHANFRVGFLCRHEVIWDVDIQQKAIHKLVTAWQEANTILLPYLLKLTAPVLLSEFSLAIFSKTTVLLLDQPRIARRQKAKTGLKRPNKIRITRKR